jgi:hypothetical protein
MSLSIPSAASPRLVLKRHRVWSVVSFWDSWKIRIEGLERRKESGEKQLS